MRWKIFSLVTLTSVALSGCGTGWDVARSNRPPNILSFLAHANSLTPATNAEIPITTGSSIVLSISADDPDHDSVSYLWTAADGTISPADKETTTFKAPTTEGTVDVAGTAKDDRGAMQTVVVHFKVSAVGNHAPTAKLEPATATMTKGAVLTLTCTPTDVDTTDKLTTTFFATSGTVTPDAANQNKAAYTAPATAGTYTVYANINDGKGGYGVAASTITVQ